jgi:hypothetical protein
VKRSLVALAILAAMGALGSVAQPVQRAKPAEKTTRAPADIVRRRAKQAAKLARRDARAKKESQS